MRFARIAPLTRFVSLGAFVAIGVATFASCSLGTGDGSVKGALDVPNCWSGPFDLQPSFFAAVPYKNTLDLRLQNGPDYEQFSDGVEILIDDLSTIRGDSTHPGLYGDALTVALPVGVAPPGVPIAANADPSTVHITLYLGKTCETQDVALYALESVSLNANGNCDPRNGGEPDVVCPGSPLGLVDGGAGEAGIDGGAGASLDGGVSAQGSTPPVGHSTITFTSLFDGNPSEVSAVDRLNEGSFTVYLADPRDACPGGLGPPPRCRGFLQGSFKFYFERGRPAQPFP